MNTSVARVKTGIAVLVTLVLGTLSPTLLRERLIPDQIAFFGDLGILGALMALVTALMSTEWLSDRKGYVVVSGIGSLAALAMLQIVFVVSIYHGDPAANHQYVVGFSLTDEGERVIKQLGTSLPESVVRRAGYDRIPDIWGWSYFVVAVGYAAAYIVAIFSITIGLVLVTLSKGAKASSETPQRRTG